MAIDPQSNIAVWSVTPNGLRLAQQLKGHWPGATIFCSQRTAAHAGHGGIKMFHRLIDEVRHNFHRFEGHLFIMAAGIVVRSIAPLLKDKTVDPAVVVVDDAGRFAISLTSGHIGGANRLAERAAQLLGATPVITTATDVNHKPAIDMLAEQFCLRIENPRCIKHVNMALLAGEPIQLHDPAAWLGTRLPGAVAFDRSLHDTPKDGATPDRAAVWIDDTICSLPPQTLVLRPPSLVAGIGCNRNTSREAIGKQLNEVLKQFALSPDSLRSIASIDLKSDEKGLCALAAEMGLVLHFFSKDQLAAVEDVPTPSATVQKHVGVPSVCEAAAILASRNGPLIVPKQSTRNVTVAIARTASTSSEPDPAI
jgi:cobalt-precorrin 5A hydrolase